MDKLYVIKIGGNIIEDQALLGSFLLSYATIKERKILVHGGGKLASQLAVKLNIPQRMIEGRRVTNDETLRLITMVYAGSVNKNIVAKLQQFHCNAIGLTGVDGNLIRARKRAQTPVDYGLAGDVTEVNSNTLSLLMEAGLCPVFASVTHDGEGQLLNTNADTIAQEIAVAMGNLYEVNLIYCFEKSGVLKDVNDEHSIIPKINEDLFENLKKDQVISEGMLPKLQNAMSALQSGVKQVVIGKAGDLELLINGNSGTTLCHE